MQQGIPIICIEDNIEGCSADMYIIYELFAPLRAPNHEQPLGLGYFAPSQAPVLPQLPPVLPQPAAVLPPPAPVPPPLAPLAPQPAVVRVLPSRHAKETGKMKLKALITANHLGSTSYKLFNSHKKK